MEMIAEGTRPARPGTRPSGTVSQLAPAAASPGEYLSFPLGAEEYGINILCVQEIHSREPPTRIAQAPAMVKGVLNLRGRAVGAVVDSVSNVVRLGAAEIRPAPAMGAAVARNFITGLGAGRRGPGSSLVERMLILMDIEGLLLDPGLALAPA